MFGNVLKQYREMRPSVRSLVSIYWIYALTTSMVGVFTQIFLYQRFASVELNITATLFLYSGIMLGFCVPGYLASVFRLNIKQGFLWSFILIGAAILLLPGVTTTQGAHLTMLLWGIGQGLFWLTINTLELSETKDGERDFYSSVLNAGNQILSLVGPAFATLLIWLSGSVFHLGTFTLLFAIAPAIYLLGFFCFSSVREYRPKPIKWPDVTYFFIDRKNQWAQLYALGTGFQQVIGITLTPLAILFILGTALSVGVYSTVFAIFSAACVLALARYRTASNRLAIYGLTTLGLVLITTMFGYFFTFTALILYTILEGLISPLNNVSSHVIDLQSMEIGRAESDFYATMLLRDFFLWIWRSIGGLIFLFLLHTFVLSQKESLVVGLYWIAATLALTYVGAYFLVKKVRR